MAKSTFKLRMYASGLGIDPARRDELVNIADELLTRFSQEQDQERLANEMVGCCRLREEVRFFCHAIDVLMKKRFRAPYRSRAVIPTWLLRRCAEIVQAQRGDA